MRGLSHIGGGIAAASIGFSVRVVSAGSANIGTGADLRIFVYDLPRAFNDDLLRRVEDAARDAGSNCDFMRSPCTEVRWNDFSMPRQLGAEVIILRRLLASRFIVSDPQLADIYVVPYFVATDCRASGHRMRCQGSSLPRELFWHLQHYSERTRHRHLFLATADMHSLPLVIQAQPLVLSLGAGSRGHPGHIVVPPSVAEAELQPQTFNASRGEVRDILFWLAATPNNGVRWLIQSELLELRQLGPLEPEHTWGETGAIVVHNTGREDGEGPPAPAVIVAEMQRAQLCPAPPAENANAGTKRLFDIVLSGCLPVVVAFATAWGSGVSWWRTDGEPIEWSLPFARTIDWRRLAIEVPAAALEAPWGFIKAAFAVPAAVREAKRQYLFEVRDALVYDLAGTFGGRDAFSFVMDEIQAALPKLGAGPTSIVCSSAENGFAGFWEVPPVMGMEDTETSKDWAHSSEEVACTPSTAWRNPALDLRPPRRIGSTSSSSGSSSSSSSSSGNGGDGISSSSSARSSSGTVVQRFTLRHVHVGQRGVYTFVHVLDHATHGAQEPAAVVAAALGAAPISVCGSENLPRVCHDVVRINKHASLEVLLCSIAEETRRGTLRTTCHQLPALLPRVAPEPLLPSPESATEAFGSGPRESEGLHWELVTCVCALPGADLSSYIAEWEHVWNGMEWPHPLGSALRHVLYDTCSAPTPALQQQQPHAVLAHLLAVAYAQRRGERVADALLLAAGAASAFVPGLSKLYMASVALWAQGMPRVAARQAASSSVWLLVLDAPRTTEQSTDVACEFFWRIFSNICPLPDRSLSRKVRMVGFPAALLRKVNVVDLEVALSTSRWAGVEDHHVFDLIVALLMERVRRDEIFTVAVRF